MYETVSGARVNLCARRHVIDDSARGMKRKLARADAAHSWQRNLGEYSSLGCGRRSLSLSLSLPSPISHSPETHFRYRPMASISDLGRSVALIYCIAVGASRSYWLQSVRRRYVVASAAAAAVAY